MECGENICGDICGECGEDQACVNGKCPDIPGWECDDGNAVPWDGCTGGKVTEWQVNEWWAGEQREAEVVGLDNGKLLHLWQSQDQDGDASGVFGKLCEPEAACSDEFQLNEESSGNQVFPQAAVLKDGGGVIAVWMSYLQDGDSHAVVSRRLDSDGAPAEEEEIVNTHTTGGQQLGSVAALDGGGYVVVWQGPGPTDGIGAWGRVYESSGMPKGPQFALNQTTDNAQGYTSACGLPGGGFAAAWFSDKQDGDNYGIYQRLFQTTGSPSTDESAVNQTTDHHQTYPICRGAPNGTHLIAWQSYTPNPEFPNDKGKYHPDLYARSDHGCTPWWS